MNLPSPKREVKSLIEQFFRAMDTQDGELMNRLLPGSQTMVHVGTDTGEIWKGADELWEATEAQFRSLEYYKADIRDLTINLSSSGEVAWYFHLLDARIKSGETETVWKGARFTGVAEKCNGKWVLTQTHVSLPESFSVEG